MKNDTQSLDTQLLPPDAKQVPHELEKHGDIRIDEYYWMNERDHPEVIAYLEAENTYYEHMTAHTKPLQQKLFEEMKARIKEDDESVPYKYNGYWYYTRFEIGKNYPLYCRKEEAMTAPEEVMFDNNEMAEGHSYFKQAGYSISENNEIAVYGIDTVSRRQYDLQFKNLKTGEIYLEVIKNTTGRATWGGDNKTVFYTRKDPQTLRSSQIFKHVLGTEASEDVMVYEELDETFDVGIFKSKSLKYIFIGASSTLTSEYRYTEANGPDFEFKIIQERTRGLEYGVSHFGDYFYLVTNKDKATNFKLVKTPVVTPSMENWVEVIPHREDTLLEDIEIFEEYLVVEERNDGLNKINIKRWDETADYYLPFNSETYTVFASINPDFDTELLRYSYNALDTPPSVVSFNMRTKGKEILKEVEVLGGNFDKDNYESKRIWATAKDGVKIPISIVYKKGITLDGSNPLLQYAYGSYGITTDPAFSTSRLSLLDNGFIFAIAHVRGGEYLGRNWYEEGKLLKKMNTFTDFIACSTYLIEQGYTNSNNLYAYGGSAGGLLMGGILNMAPELYNGVIAAVPFVDVVTTMLDDSIPLTTSEYDEWGNPNDKKYYDYMKSYSPYDQVTVQNYPNILITTGYHDSQVQYWEPAKWVARLRDKNIADTKIYFETNMDAGHGGASGRFEALKETAKDYAFLIDLAGKSK
ncbi:oligopeptidase B [Leeuwenhoekiella aestuarii]|uniref:Proline-specific endopeptidase n=1 Tax=Leeuwenhoekiella aestuarii TaxID=2249426 RepID=A0A4Q0NX81_9FLAO|nr:S9 family peptidase [Leeuwenhoekiella aestuarii]RXG16066.1 oligopeptidase B [Leeuwenhoekiella aestuarii]RXG16760.1 oligopeptidase B [Leeuwenhoekiella aestuarii]